MNNLGGRAIYALRPLLIASAVALGALLAYQPLVGFVILGLTASVLALWGAWRMFVQTAKADRFGLPILVGSEGSDWRVWALAGIVLLYGLMGPWLVELGWLRGGLGAINLAICTVGFVTGFRPKLRPIQTIWFCFQLSWLGIAPIYQISQDFTNWGDGSVWFQTSNVDQAFALNTLSSIAALIGFRWASRMRGTTAVDTAGCDAKPAGPLGSYTAKPAAWICLVISCVLAVRVVSVAGGLGGLFASRSQLDTAIGNALGSYQLGGISYALVDIFPGAFAVAATLLFLKSFYDTYRTGGSPKVLELVACGASLTLAFVLDNPWSSARQLTAAAMGSIAIAVWRPRGRRAGAIFAVAALFAVLLVYPLANAFKSSHDSGTFGLHALATPDFDGFQEWVNTVSYVHAVGHSWGIHTASALLYFVPRSLWHTKAVPSSLLVAQHAGYSFTNLSLPLQAEMYMEFGAFGMVIAIGLICFLLGRCDAQWLAAPWSKLAALTPFLAVAILPVIRGPLGGAVPFPLTVLAVLAINIRSSKAILALRSRLAPEVANRNEGEASLVPR